MVNEPSVFEPLKVLCINLLRRLNQILSIGVGRFWILGWGGKGGKVQNIGGGAVSGDKPFAGCKLIGAPAPNQCQTITFFTLKTDNTAKLRIELKSVPLEITSNKIQGTYITLVFLLFHIGIEGKCSWTIRGGGGKRYIAPPPPKLTPHPSPLPLFLRLC